MIGFHCSNRAAVEGALLSFSDVSLRRRDGVRETVVLERASFDLHAGESLGIYGERRVGKSTLLRLAAGLERPDSGSIRLAGRELALVSAGERARLLRGPVALLSWEGWLPSPGETVMDHVAVAAGSVGLSLREARRRALAVLDRAGVAAVAAQEATAALGSVERARVMLARALVREPRLLLVDEPAPMPSLAERDRFCALLRSISKEGTALLVASEDMSALQGLDALASLSGGELYSTQENAMIVRLPDRRTATERK